MKLVQTCAEFPEQYNVRHMGRLVGYLRLRFGIFTAQYPNVHGRVVYRAQPRGTGRFEDDERQEHLDAAKLAILLAMEADAAPRERVPRTSTEVAASLAREAVRIDGQLTDISAAFERARGDTWARLVENMTRDALARGTTVRPQPGVEYVREFSYETPFLRTRPAPDQL